MRISVEQSCNDPQSIDPNNKQIYGDHAIASTSHISAYIACSFHLFLIEFNLQCISSVHDYDRQNEFNLFFE